MKKTLLLKTMLLLCALVVGTSSSWADNFVINTTNFTKPNSGSGYAAYDGDRSIGGVTITSSNVMINNSSLQFKKSGGNLYNKNAMPGNITKITLASPESFTIYVGTSSSPSTTTVTSGTTISGNYTYFKIINSTSGALSTATITVEYSSTLSVTYNGNGNTSGSVPTDATAYASGATVTVLGNTGSLAKSGYTFGGWNTQADGLGTNYTAGNTFTISANTTLYAKWNAKNITGLTCEGTPTKTTYNEGESFDPTGLTVTATFDDESAENVTTSVSWTPDPLTAGTTSVTGTYMEQNVVVNGLTVNVAPGSETNPYTVAEAILATPSSGTSDKVYIRGIVCKFYGTSTSIMGDGTNYRYYVSDDGSTESALLVYRGKGLNEEAFSNASDLLIGDEVVIYGGLTTYQSQAEVASGNYLISRTTKEIPSFTVSPTESTLSMGNTETVDVTLTTNTDGVITCESDDEDVATVALKSAGVYTITAQSAGTATITIKSAASSTYYPATATVDITVVDNREDAGISFEEDEITKTWGEDYTGQTLTNPHALTVTYSSTNEAVATVNASGVVEIKKAGTTTIKATFDGNATYKKSVASYSLKINKADAGLSYTVTSYDVDLNDDSFVAPTLNNPNNLTVTYSSNDEDVALVDENTGEVYLNTSSEGTAKITASFAGNDNFKSGSAYYTINVIDPNRKGSKKNPYTVAEVLATSGTINDVYVEGYIVGYVKGTTSFTKIVSEFANSNWAIADNYDETVFANVTGVQISGTTTNQPKYGLASNPELVGYKCLVKGDIMSYFSKQGVKNIDEYILTAASATIPASGYGTLSSDYALDFANATDASNEKTLTAYVIPSNDGAKIDLAEITAAPENTGVLLKGNAGETYMIPVVATADPVGDNLLKAGPTTVAANNETIYLLKSGQFHLASEGTTSAGKAYLELLTPINAHVLTFDSEATGIANLNVDGNANFDNDAPMYNLAGQRVTKSYKGVVIVNGKKVVRK